MKQLEQIGNTILWFYFPDAFCPSFIKVGPFCDPQPQIPIFFKKDVVFTLLEASKYMFVYKIFLAKDLFGKIIDDLLCQHNKYHAYWSVQQYDTVKHA